MSTSQGLGIIGAAIGAFVGGPAGAQWGYAIGSTVGSIIDPEVIKGPDLGDAKQQTSQAGIPIVKVYGMPAPFAGTIIDGDPVSRKYTKREQQGKGGPVVETEGFRATRAILVCEGEVDFARIWRNNKLVYSTIAGDALDPDSANFLSQARLYRGTETQLPDPSLEALHGVGNTPYYRGRAYMVVIDDDETQTGGAANQYLFQVAACADITPANAWLLTGQYDFGSGIKNAHWTSTDLVEWDGPYQRTGSGSTETTNGAYSTGTSIIFFKRNSTYYEVCTDLDPANHFPVTAATFPYTVKIIRCFGGGVAVAITADPNTGTAGPGYYGVTLNGGQSWSWYMAPTSAGSTPCLWDIARLDSGRWVAIVGSVDAGMHRAVYSDSDFTSTPSWTLAATQPTNVDKSAIACCGSGAVIHTPNGAFSGYTSMTSNGNTWTVVRTGAPQRATAGALQGYRPGFVFECDGSGYGVLSAPAGGTPWNLLSSIDVARFTTDETTVVGMLDQSDWVPYASTDGGQTFSAITLPPGASNSCAVEWIGATTSGIQIPDAPGYYVNYDGEISGQSGATLTACAAIWSEIALDIASRTACPESKLDVDNMTDEVPGFILARADLTGNDYLRALCGPYFATLPEYDGQLHAVRYGGASVATLTADDLLEIEPEDTTTRRQVIEAPARVTLAYPDPANNYVVTPQAARRSVPDIQSTGETTVQTVIPFSADQAARIADKMQKVSWTRVQGGFTRALVAKWSKLVPSDPITWTDGQRYIIESARYEDSMVTIECSHDRVSDYSSAANGSSAPAPQGQSSNTKGPSILSVMNLPPLTSAETTSGVHLAVQGLLPGWPGADIYLSVDDGTTEQLVMSITDAAVIGVLGQDCDADGGDSTGLLNVQVYIGGELSSITDAQVDARQNGFVLSTGGVDEIGQFKDAAETSTDRNYDLTNVTRGELGTTAAAHSAGDRFVLLDGAVKFLPINAKYAGQTLIFRAVTKGTVPANNDTVSIVYDPAEIILDGGEVT